MSKLAVLETARGTIHVNLFEKEAPKTVANFVGLAEGSREFTDPQSGQKVTRPFYDGVVFHRVIDGFMAQTGDVEHGKQDGASVAMAGTGGSDLPDLEAEFNDVSFQAGTVGMARAQDPNSANSQFFICFDDARFLDRQYTVWGQVESGMEHVDALPKGEPPRQPGKIVKATVS